MNTALSLYILVEPIRIRKRKLKGISEKQRLHYPSPHSIIKITDNSTKQSFSLVIYSAVHGHLALYPPRAYEDPR
ncbi:hypothetical protein SAMN05216593_11376 [Pseudomonas asturiensis]|uniref:Uncharacterized protein n=1 Tax=Pseudomonas asturiensis TaxID=1190415 RepID=A0A1M7PTR8_9PSED|nr:hypothetical protein SAMN05216593_11376 [Pseudomonas asturiensis]